MNLRDKIIVALDTQDKAELAKLISSLKGHASFVKVGMELYYTFGPQIIRDLKSDGFKIFLDLKIHDIPNTAKKAAKTLTKLGVEIFNFHAAGGPEMLAAGISGIKEALKENSDLKKPLVIAVTQLTSTNQSTLEKHLLINRKLEEVVLSYAKMAKECELNGVVCSPLEVEKIKHNLGPQFLTITPGVRPAGSATSDQKRVTTPAEAIRMGSDYLVIGRPITEAHNPGQAFDNFLKEIQSV